jgi:hypothetical protein
MDTTPQETLAALYAAGFVVTELFHSTACAECVIEADSAFVTARVSGSVGATHSRTHVVVAGAEPRTAHSATVLRITEATKRGLLAPRDSLASAVVPGEKFLDF